LGDTGPILRPSNVDNGESLFSSHIDYEFGFMVNETWMLSKEEYVAAFNSLMIAARGGREKSYWMVPNNESGVFRNSYARDISFCVMNYLPEQVRFNEDIESIFMSTELMYEHFPFLAKSD